MTDNVVYGDFNPSADLPAELALKDAMDSELTQVVIAGFKNDGNIFVSWATAGDVAKSLLLLELARQQMLDGLLQ